MSNIIAMSATWMQRIAQDWLVLELTGSVAAVGITVAFQFAPMLLLGLFGGVIVDRYSKRMLLMVSQAITGVLSALLAVLALTGVVEVWHVYIVALVVGFVQVIDNPARQVFVNEIVGPRHLRNAISVNSSIFQLGGLLGPAAAGLLIVVAGAGWAFGVNAAACAITVLALAKLKVSALMRIQPTPRAKGQLRQGLTYLKGKPTIMWTVVMLAFLAMFALNMPVILAAYATDVFASGAGGYGLLNSLVATGALVGGLASTLVAGVRLRSVILAGGAWGLLQTGAGLVAGEVAFWMLLVALGIASMFFFTAANQLIQLSSNLGVRGRMMSIYVLVMLGGQAIGGPAMGWIVEHEGAQFGMVLSGSVPALAAVAIAVHLARRGSLILRVSLRRTQPFVAIVPQR